MRQIPVAALAKVASKLGTEPVNILAVEWRPNAPLYYADKDIIIDGVTVMRGLILNKTQIDTVLNLEANRPSAVVTIELDDTDGSLKTLLNNYNLHKRPAVLYQWYEGLTLAQKFPVFSGEVASPIVWSEGDRTLSFDLTSIVEDKEAGFSPESGQFPFVSEAFISKPWPMVFGRCVFVPAQKVRETVTGQLRELIGLVDTTLEPKLGLLDSEEATLIAIANRVGTLQNLASDLAPAASQILQNYIQAILNEDTVIREVIEVEEDIKDLETDKANEPNEAARGNIEDDIKDLKDDLEELQERLNGKLLVKQAFEVQAKNLVYEHKLLNELDGKAEAVTKRFQELYDVRSKIKTILAKQEPYVKSVFRVAKGRTFPQGVPTDIIIDDMRFRGTFDGELFTVIAAGLPKYTNIAVQEYYNVDRLDTFYIVDESKNLVGNYCLTTGGKIIRVTSQIGNEVIFELREKAADEDGAVADNNDNYGGPSSSQPQGPLSANTQSLLASAFPIDQTEYTTLKTLEDIKYIEQAPNVLYQIPAPKTNYAVTAADIGGIAEVARVPLPHWFSFGEQRNIKELPESTAWHAEVGAQVMLADDYTEIYVANILPSTVHAVHAYRSIEGVKKLVPIPQAYYEKSESQTLGNLTVTSFILPQPLSAYVGQNWDDGIYVTLTSSVGPNTVDILQHLIETYTSGTIDSGTFTSVHDKVEEYPSDFAVFERKNVLDLLQEIAWQARIGIWENNGVFYLRYLSEQPNHIESLTQSDVLEQSISLSFTRTEEVVTKFIALYKEDYSQTEPIKLTLRHNVNLYGSLEREFDFYIYNNRDLVEKSATFWMIRYCNTWKIAKFKLPLTKLKIESLDAVLLNFAEKYFSTAPVVGIVQSAAYDTIDNSIDVEVWIPVRAGEMVKYDYAWPSGLAVDIEFPTQDDINSGAAGSGFPDEAVGTIGDYSVDLNINTRPSDYGQRYLSDNYARTIPNPVDGFEEGDGQVHDPDAVDVPNGDPIDPEPDARPDPAGALRNSFIARVIRKVDNQPFTWLVAFRDGTLANAIQLKTGPFDRVRKGTFVTVVRGDKPDEWYMQAETTTSVAIAELEIVQVYEDYIECKDPHDPNDAALNIKVAKPFHLQLWNWDEITFDNIRYAKHPADEGDGLLRKAKSMPNAYEITEIVKPPYIPRAANDDGPYDLTPTLVCGQLPYAVPCGDPDADEPVITNWIDLNTEGRVWADVWENKLFEGTLLETLVAGGSAKVKIGDNPGRAPGNSPVDDDYSTGHEYDPEDNTGADAITADDFLLASGDQLESGTQVIVGRTHKGQFKVIGAKCS